MKVYFLSIVLVFTSLLCTAHGGEDHGEEKKQTNQKGKSYLTVNSVSEVFELVLRYEPIKAKEKTVMKLFLSEFATNIPIDKASIDISSSDLPNLKFKVTASEPGIYLIEGIFPQDQSYNLIANISKDDKADLMLIEDIDVGQKIVDENHSKKTLFEGSTIYVLLIGIGLGIVLTYILIFILNQRRNRRSI